MKPITFEEIKNIAEYEAERDHSRPSVLALKDRRRIRVGSHFTFLFENRETVRYQIQEMMRMERMVHEHDIRHEIENYNHLIPKVNSLCASLLIEYETPKLLGVWLRKLRGLEHHIWFEVKGTPQVKAMFDHRQISKDGISSVHYISFQLSAEQVASFKNGASLVVDHPAYAGERHLASDQLKELSHDFV